MAETETGSSYIASSSSGAASSSNDSQTPPLKRQRMLDRNWKAIDSQRSFKEDWRKQYFVIPHPVNSSQCLCLVCRAVFTQLKSHTIKRHFESKHKPFVSLDSRAKSNKYDRLLAAYESERNVIRQPTEASRQQLLATYKLAYIICKYKHPFSAAEDFMEFARLADPDSQVFRGASASRRTITRRIEETADYILRSELVSSLEKSPFFCLLLDDSLDKSTHEQCILMVRYVDFSTFEIVTRFLGIVRIVGTPNAATIFEAIQALVENDLKLQTHKLICVTADGTSVMQGTRNSVSVHLLNAWNVNAFRQHCVIHKEVVGVKKALKQIPPKVEETVSKILGYFKYSGKRLDKFELLLGLTDPTKLTNCKV